MEEWYVNGTYAGTWQTGRNLTYVRVSPPLMDHGCVLTLGSRWLALRTWYVVHVSHDMVS